MKKPAVPQVTITHHVDASEPDANGKYDYYYEYDLFRFTEGDVTLVARSYIEKPNEAHLLRMEFSGKVSPICANYLELPLVSDAVHYLKKSGKEFVNWRSSSGSTPVKYKG